MINTIESYNNIDIKDDFMFCTVMKNPELCRTFLETVLGISIKEIRYTETQKSYDVIEKAKSIRLDVYVNDDKGTVYDIEMQKCNSVELPKRSRYYSGLIDIDLIQKGQPYRRLPKSIILFICNFDPFKPRNRAFYSFENRCADEPELLLGDESLKAFVNIKGDLEKLPEKMQAVLKYMDKGIVSDEFTASLDKEVNIVRNNEKWRLEYMTLQDKMDEKYEQGLEHGIEQGKAEERARYLLLYRCLKNDNRLEVLDEADIDVEILYREYGL